MQRPIRMHRSKIPDLFRPRTIRRLEACKLDCANLRGVARLQVKSMRQAASGTFNSLPCSLESPPTWGSKRKEAALASRHTCAS